jgi:hypothetical protein
MIILQMGMLNINISAIKYLIQAIVFLIDELFKKTCRIGGTITPKNPRVISSMRNMNSNLNKKESSSLKYFLGLQPCSLVNNKRSNKINMKQ